MKAPPAHAIDAALQDGRSFVDPSAEEQAALGLVVHAGIAQVVEDRVFRCFDPTDDASTYDAVDRGCFTWVPWNVPDGADPESWEDGGYVVCPRCGREHHPTVDGRTAHLRVGVTIVPEGVIAWVDAALQEVDPALRRLRAGVGWEMVVGDREVDLIWLDASAGTPLTTRARALTRDAVWLVTRRAPWAQIEVDEPWLVLLSLAEWLADPRTLNVAIVRTRRDGPPLLSDPSLRPWAPPTTPTRKVFVDRVGAHELRIGDDGIWVDRWKVVPAHATSSIALLRALAVVWREDVGAGLADDAHRSLDVAALRAAMKHRGNHDSLRKLLDRVRDDLHGKYTVASGIGMDKDAVIERTEAGWRLHPRLLVVGG
jgi:hypothetical protein